jgi:hypothetical protein
MFMSKKITFNAVNSLADLTVSIPKPAKTYIPNWYKEVKTFKDGKKDYSNIQLTFKACMPFFDSLSLGYIQETWQEINIGSKGEAFTFNFPTDPKIMSFRDSVPDFEIPDQYYPYVFTWHSPSVSQLPKGYSALITHPLNRFDLPFLTLSGVMDCDTYNHSLEDSNLPFLLKKGFDGVIPIGTPMYQIIPFKREDWSSSKNEYDANKQIQHEQKIRRYFYGGYKKLHWKRKSFE